jgi:hypothetical protein
VIGFDERGALTESVDFDYDAVDERMGNAMSLNQAAVHPNSQNQASIVPLQQILDWVCQKVPKNQNGIEIRATIAAWIFLPHLRTLNLTEVAAMVGRDKQSLGRWVDDFKKRFPGVHAVHTRQ